MLQSCNSCAQGVKPLKYTFKKCDICRKRCLWRIKKMVKCVACKTIFHKRCLAATVVVPTVEDYNDENNNYLDKVTEYYSSATSVNRTLENCEIVGAKSTLYNSFYRVKVIRKIYMTTYLIQYIDFGDKDNVSSSYIFEIPKYLMDPSSKIMKITLKGVNPNQMNIDTSNYISSLMSNYVPMIIKSSSKQYLNDVILTKAHDNENVNERINELLNTNSSSSLTEVINQSAPEINKGVPAFKNGALVCIEYFKDVHNIFLRKFEYRTNEFINFIDSVHSYCAAETPIGKLPKINDIIGVKSITDGYFHRAMVLKKINYVSYNIWFIDYGVTEIVSLLHIVSLSNELKQVVHTVVLTKLKNVSLCKLNEAAREYVSLTGAKEYLLIANPENVAE